MSMKYTKYKKSYAFQPLTTETFMAETSGKERLEVDDIIAGCNGGDLCLITRNGLNDELQVTIVDYNYFPEEYNSFKGLPCCRDFYDLIYIWKKEALEA